MRRLRYQVAMSLDGYIAGPRGEIDWITMDPDIDFTSFTKQFDTILVGRKTFETMVAFGQPFMPGMRTIVFSTTLRQEDHPKAVIVANNHRAQVADIKASPGRDIWLFGGGVLFRTLAHDGLVDTVAVAVIPILLGSGIPLVPESERAKLSLTSHKIYKTGIVSLEYRIEDINTKQPAT